VYLGQKEDSRRREEEDTPVALEKLKIKKNIGKR